MMTPAESNDVARAINAGNARLTQRAEAAADFLAVMVIAALAVAALLHFLEPCRFEGALCAAFITPTCSSWWQRLLTAPRQWYLRVCLRAAESDVLYHRETAHLAPKLEKLAQQRVDELRVLLIDLDLSSRAR
jgi:hypothetical protein